MSWNVLGHSDYFSDCRGCCKKVQNTRPESKKMSLSTSWGSQFLWFWSNLHTNCFPVICPTSKFRKISFGEDTTLSEWAVAEKVSNSRFFVRLDTVCLFGSHSQGTIGESVVLLSTLAAQHNVYNAHWMVAVRFLNLELGPIEFLTHWLQNFRVQNRHFKVVANTVDKKSLLWLHYTLVPLVWDAL